MTGTSHPPNGWTGNWSELLQELRVIQTGVQLLTGFLLTLPFQQRFTILGTGERAVYLATAASSIVATVFLQAPVVVHRFLFRRHQKAETVRLAHRLALVGMLHARLGRDRGELSDPRGALQPQGRRRSSRRSCSS